MAEAVLAMPTTLEARCPACGNFLARITAQAVAEVEMNCQYRSCGAKRVIARLKPVGVAS